MLRYHLLSFMTLVMFVHSALAQTETEPNQSIAEAAANPLYSPGVAYSGSIADGNPMDNADFFRIELPVDATIVFEAVASAPEASNVAVAIFTGEGAAIGFQGGGFGGGPSPVNSTFSFRCFTAGTYFFRLTSNQGSNIQYSLLWNFEPPLFGNDEEPNADGTAALANGLLTNATWREGHHSFASAEALTDNVDVHALSIPEDGSVQLEVIGNDPFNPGASLQVLLYDSIGNQMGGMFAPTGLGGNDTDTTQLQITCLKNGYYFIILYGVNTCGTSYRLRYTFTPALYADDNDATTALTSGTWTEGHLSFNGNGSEPFADNFTFELPEHHFLRVELITSDLQNGGATPDLRVYDSNGLLSGSWFGESGPTNDPDTNSYRLGCLSDGIYSLGLSHINSCGVSYRLRVFIDPPVYGTDDEPNDDIATAQSAVPDIDNGGFLGAGETDYWLFYKDSEGPLNMDLRVSSQTDFSGTLIGTLYDLDGNFIDQVNLNTGITNSANNYTSITFAYNSIDTLILRITGLNIQCFSYSFRYEGSGAGVNQLTETDFPLLVRPIAAMAGQFEVIAPEDILGLEVFTMQGSIVFSARSKRNIGTIDLSHVASGTYICRALCADGIARTAKLMVKI